MMYRLVLWVCLLPLSLAAQQMDVRSVIGRGLCTVTDGVLRTKDAYACFGDTAWRDYQFSFRASGVGSVVPAGAVHICAGFRARNRDDRYVFGLKGGRFNALYLERLGFMGTDDYLALRPLEFPVTPGTWYRFRVQVLGDRIRIFLGDETLPRIDVRDPNTGLCPNGQVTLGGSYIPTEYAGLEVQPLTAMPGRVREGEASAAKRRRLERAAFQPVRVSSIGAGRTEVSLDGNWLFEPGYELPDAEEATSVTRSDQGWHVLHVPDFWNPSRVWLHGEKYKDDSKGASDKYYQQEIDRCEAYTFDYKRTDIGWYRQWIELPKSVAGKHIELSFDAVSKVAEVWVNGQAAGSHIGMFGNFTLDVSSLLHPGKNLVTVKVLKEYVQDIKDADKVADVAVTVEVTQRMIKDLAHGFFVDDPAGIWQPVKLTITDPLHISDVFIKPGLTGADMEVTVRNDGPKDKTFALRTAIDSLYTGLSVPNQTIKAWDSVTLRYAVEGLHPRLWSPEDPQLYNFRFSTGSDTVTVCSGFRTFEARDGFFYLNGHRYWLRGANQTAMPLGPNDGRLADRFCQLMHDAHLNATRTHTVPFTETWLEAADRVGLGVSYEGTWPWLMIESTMPSQTLIDLWAREFLDLLHKYRNHPSLLLWTVNNEMKFYDNDPDIERAKLKMRIISAVVKRMRQIDPTRPVVFDSNYHRGKRFGAGFFKEVDDGDVDDIHMYPNWYDNSIFDQFKGEFQARYKNEGRPLISQEMSTGYSNNETGHPVRFYTFVHQTPQALVGKYAYDYADPSLFLTTHAFITKELAEAFRRTDSLASGTLHFAAITWFRNVYSADSIQPYPVYYAMQKAMQPLLVSGELWGRHFYGGARLPVRVCVVNDQDDRVLAEPSTLQWSIESVAGPASGGEPRVLASGSESLGSVPYYGRRWLSPEVTLPTVSGRVDARLVLKIVRDGRVLSSNDYAIVLGGRSWAAGTAGSKSPAPVSILDYSGRLSGVLDTLGIPYHRYTTLTDALSSSGPLMLAGLNPGDDPARIRAFVSGGGRVLVLNPGSLAASLYPRYIKGVLDSKGEIMNMDIPESPLFDGLEPLDLRYFNDNLRESPSVCAGAFQINRGAGLEAPLSYTRVHGYLQGDIAQREAKLETLRGFPVVLIRDKGGAILSEVLYEKAVTDPVAGRLLGNMIKMLQTGF
ncbi:glycoside hydrolase family 2 protein [Dinghuibacter silviterrae]|uniref:beta-galactosidase n=1 Tax=Dinghuibacter silviterrae TaxID=1539049 RepID=A0A4R8DVV8_9BACT|nr:glycoside hydrolase family 2 TIM barrel-domain containing protein [Dinghuibacter silviterrae]TDX02068.1 glycosyl hydrolase family 2 [Dinghuibacter silviterrae]